MHNSFERKALANLKGAINMSEQNKNKENQNQNQKENQKENKNEKKNSENNNIRFN